jgi:hypothetical protein
LGQIDPINLSSVSTDLSVTAPATPAVGDWFGYYLSGRNQNWKATLNRNGNTVNGDTSTTNFTLQERGDHAVWRYLSGTWVPVQLRRTVLTTTPLSIAGCQLWLDANDANTLYDATSGGSLVAANGGVARWEDKSGNARHVTQSTSGARPLRKTGVQNGLDVLRLDGSDDFMQRTSFAFFASSGFTGFVVAKADEIADRWLMSWTIPSDNDDYGLIALRRDGASPARNQFYFSGGNTTISETVDTTGYVALTIRLTSGTMTAHRNGSLVATQSGITEIGKGDGGRNIPARSILNLGALVRPANPSGGFFFKGDYCELLWYDSGLSDANRAAVESYLTTKWGIT